MGKPEKARQILHRLLEMRPDHQAARLALQNLEQ
jgi:hypothetical protein